MKNEIINDIFCECGKIFNEKEYSKHYRHCKMLHLKYKDFDFKFTQLLKKYFNSIQSLTILTFLFKKLIQVFENKIQNFYISQNIDTPNHIIIQNDYNSKFDESIINKDTKNDTSNSIITSFIDMYPQKILSDGEKGEIHKYLYIKNNYMKNDVEGIFFDMMCLFSIIMGKKNNKSVSIRDILKKKPNYIYIKETTEKFFNDFSTITIEKYYDVFLFIELLFSDSINEKLPDQYKIDLDNKLKDNINNYFNDGKPKLIGKIILSNACRKIMTRFLANCRPDENINPDTLLFPYLNKSDYWEPELIKNNEITFKQELENISKFDIKFKHIFKLCLLLDRDNSFRKNAIEKIIKAES